MNYTEILTVLIIFSALADVRGQSSAPTQQDTLSKFDKFNQKMERFFKYAPAPIITYSTEAGKRLGWQNSIFSTLLKKTTISKPSKLAEVVTVSTKGRVNISVANDLILKENKYMILSYFNYKKTPEYLLGIGNDVSLDDVEEVTVNRLKFATAAMRLVKENYYAGISLDFSDYYGIETDSNSFLIRDDVSGLLGGTDVGVGLAGALDSRGNRYNAYKGALLLTTITFYPKFLGSHYEFTSIYIDARKYFNVWRKHVLAIQATTTYTSGDVPFYDLALMGGEDRMRGYYKGALRDKVLFDTQVEYRMPIWNIFGLATWVATGRVADSYGDMSLDGFWLSYGGGIRIRVDSENNTNLRFDMGFGPNGVSGFYFNFAAAGTRRGRPAGPAGNPSSGQGRRDRPGKRGPCRRTASVRRRRAARAAGTGRTTRTLPAPSPAFFMTSNPRSRAYPRSSRPRAFSTDRRVVLPDFLEVIEDEHVRVVRGGRLLEAPMRLAEQSVEAGLHLGHGVRVDDDLRRERAGDELVRQRDGRRRLAFEDASGGAGRREAVGRRPTPSVRSRRSVRARRSRRRGRGRCRTGRGRSAAPLPGAAAGRDGQRPIGPASGNVRWSDQRLSFASRLVAVPLATVSGRSIRSPAVTSAGNFTSTASGLRTSMSPLAAPSRPSRVCPAARTRYAWIESLRWKETLPLPSCGRTSSGCQRTVSVKSVRVASPSAAAVRVWAYSRATNGEWRTTCAGDLAGGRLLARRLPRRLRSAGAAGPRPRRGRRVRGRQPVRHRGVFQPLADSAVRVARRTWIRNAGSSAAGRSVGPTSGVRALYAFDEAAAVGGPGLVRFAVSDVELRDWPTRLTRQSSPSRVVEIGDRGRNAAESHDQRRPRRRSCARPAARRTGRSRAPIPITSPQPPRGVRSQPRRVVDPRSGKAACAAPSNAAGAGSASSATGNCSRAVSLRGSREFRVGRGVVPCRLSVLRSEPARTAGTSSGREVRPHAGGDQEAVLLFLPNGRAEPARGLLGEPPPALGAEQQVERPRPPSGGRSAGSRRAPGRPASAPRRPAGSASAGAARPCRRPSSARSG